jgi:phosphoglycolate phosphatase
MGYERLSNIVRTYKHVIWDWNGTLLDDVDACYSTIVELMSSCQMTPISLDEYLAKFRFPVIEYYKDIGFDFSIHSFDRLAEKWIALYRDNQKSMRLFPDIPAFLTGVRAAGTKSHILTAAFEADVHVLTKKYDIAHLFENIYGQNNHHAVSKVVRGRELLQHLNVSPRDLVLVGDTDHDAEVALDLGIDAILLDQGHQAGRDYSPLARSFEDKGIKLTCVSRAGTTSGV